MQKTFDALCTQIIYLIFGLVPVGIFITLLWFSFVFSRFLKIQRIVNQFFLSCSRIIIQEAYNVEKQDGKLKIINNWNKQKLQDKLIKNSLLKP